MAGSAASTGTGSRILDELAEVIGEEAALDLAWAFKGIDLYVPKDPATEPRIAEAIGQDAANRLCEIFYRTYVYMPFTLMLRRKVLALAAKGDLSRRDIALELGIPERRVYRILERGSESPDDAPRQDAFL